MLRAMSRKQQMILDSTAQLTIIGGAAGCVSAETEFLTPQGWVSFCNYHEGMEVGQYDPNSDLLSFSKDVSYIKAPCDTLTLMQGKGMEMALSDEHKVLYWPTKELNPRTLPFHEVMRRHEASKTKGWTGKIKTSFRVAQKGLDISEGDLRLQVAVMADGSVVKGGKDNYTKMRFAKKRKYDRLINLCKDFNLRYDDRGWKPCERYSSGKKYEVIVWPILPDKRFDSKYYQCSQEQLEIIADEVRHWDGSEILYSSGKSLRFYSKYKEDSDFIQYVFASCGMNTNMVFDIKKGSYENSTGYWTVNGNSIGGGFRSFANKDRKNELKAIPTSDGFKYCFTTQTGFFVARLNNKIFLTGNSAKSHILMLTPLNIIDDPRTAIIMFRRTTPQLTGQGGLVDKARMIYDELPVEWRPTFTQNPWKAQFPNGASIVWRPMQHVNDKYDIQGLEFTLIGVDEGTQFEAEQLEYMMSRLRSGSRYKSRMIVSCNPDPDHIICEWIKDYYLDDRGFPIEERAGHVRYFIRKDGDYIFANTQEELGERFGIPPEAYKKKIKSFTFIPATIYDNPWMLENNEEYLAELEALEPVERDRLLHGCWFARPEGSSYFKRKWLQGDDNVRVKRRSDVPTGLNMVRGVDRAHTEPHEGNRDPNYTAFSPLCGKDKDGYYWLVGEYHEDLIDPQIKSSDIPVIGRIRRNAGDRNNLIVKQGLRDKELKDIYNFNSVKLITGKDNGAGGSDYQSLFIRCSEDKVSLVADKEPSNVEAKKVKDFLGFAEAAQNKIVYIVEESFPPETLEAFYKELEKFNGQKSTRTIFDDWVDSISMAFNCARDSKRPYQTIIRNQRQSDTLSSRILNNREE